MKQATGRKKQQGGHKTQRPQVPDRLDKLGRKRNDFLQDVATKGPPKSDQMTDGRVWIQQSRFQEFIPQVSQFPNKT